MGRGGRSPRGVLLGNKQQIKRTDHLSPDARHYVQRGDYLNLWNTVQKSGMGYKEIRESKVLEEVFQTLLLDRFRYGDEAMFLANGGVSLYRKHFHDSVYDLIHEDRPMFFDTPVLDYTATEDGWADKNPLPLGTINEYIKSIIVSGQMEYYHDAILESFYALEAEDIAAYRKDLASAYSDPFLEGFDFEYFETPVKPVKNFLAIVSNYLFKENRKYDLNWQGKSGLQGLYAKTRKDIFSKTAADMPDYFTPESMMFSYEHSMRLALESVVTAVMANNKSMVSTRVLEKAMGKTTPALMLKRAKIFMSSDRSEEFSSFVHRNRETINACDPSSLKTFVTQVANSLYSENLETRALVVNKTGDTIEKETQILLAKAAAS